MAEIQLKPEQKARAAIDQMLDAAGWVVQDFKHTAIDLGAYGDGDPIVVEPEMYGRRAIATVVHEEYAGEIRAKVRRIRAVD